MAAWCLHAASHGTAQCSNYTTGVCCEKTFRLNDTKWVRVPNSVHAQHPLGACPAAWEALALAGTFGKGAAHRHGQAAAAGGGCWGTPQACWYGQTTTNTPLGSVRPLSPEDFETWRLGLSNLTFHEHFVCSAFSAVYQMRAQYTGGVLLELLWILKCIKMTEY